MSLISQIITTLKNHLKGLSHASHPPTKPTDRPTDVMRRGRRIEKQFEFSIFPQKSAYLSLSHTMDARLLPSLLCC
jgi:hypothetical protein